MNPFTWARQSVLNRGILKTTRIAGTCARDFWFDWRHGTETRGLVPTEGLVEEAENKPHAVHYQATKAGPFLRLLKGLGLPRESGFLDLGSGKGRALLLAAQHGFRRVVGVEFSPQLCRLARANIATFEKSTPLPSPIEIVEADAARYEIGSDLNVFYLYNPFEPPVLSKVLENLRRSVASAPRRIWLIYNNPRHHELIRQSGLFGGHSCHDIGGTDFNVYTG